MQFERDLTPGQTFLAQFPDLIAVEYKAGSADWSPAARAFLAGAIQPGAGALTDSNAFLLGDISEDRLTESARAYADSMPGDGRQLEALVAFVEKTLLPQGYEVKTNERIYNEGVQIAELDVEVRGKVGSTSIFWLIECRDRPGDGPAPGSWIEQLVGRRTRFGFNKVTAVSTTGFAAGAIEFARSQGIELREVKTLTADDFSWLGLRYIQSIENRAVLLGAMIVVGESESEERTSALLDAMAMAETNAEVLKPSRGGSAVRLADAFSASVQTAGLFCDVPPNGPGKNVELTVRYPNDDDHFVIETRIGQIRVHSITFRGELYVKEILVPLSVTAEYRHLDTGQPISQIAAFGAQEIHGMKFSMELHRMSDSGDTHITLRRLDDGGS